MAKSNVGKVMPNGSRKSEKTAAGNKNEAKKHLPALQKKSRRGKGSDSRKASMERLDRIMAEIDEELGEMAQESHKEEKIAEKPPKKEKKVEKSKKAPEKKETRVVEEPKHSAKKDMKKKIGRKSSEKAKEGDFFHV